MFADVGGLYDSLFFIFSLMVQRVAGRKFSWSFVTDNMFYKKKNVVKSPPIYNNDDDANC